MSDETSNVKEELSKIEDAKKKLKVMEDEIKKQADDADKKLEAAKAAESKLVDKEAALAKKLGITDSSAVFDSMVSTVNNLYTSYYAMKGTDEGLVEAIQSILTARKSLTSN